MGTYLGIVFEVRRKLNVVKYAEEIEVTSHFANYFRLQESGSIYFFDKNTWTRLLSACVKLYKDVLMLENFAIMNYCV